MPHTNITGANQAVTLKSGAEIVIEPGATVKGYAIKVREAEEGEKPTSKKDLIACGALDAPKKEDKKDAEKS